MKIKLILLSLTVFFNIVSCSGQDKKESSLISNTNNTKTLPSIIDNLIKSNKYFVKTFDINKDGYLDKIICSNPYEGEELFIFIGDKNSNYQQVLKTINFSQDGGNQISDIKHTNNGFEIVTKFPDKGVAQTNYYIENSNNDFILKKIKNEFYSWQDKYTNTCIQNFNFDMKNSIEVLFETIANTKENCTKRYDNNSNAIK